MHGHSPRTAHKGYTFALQDTGPASKLRANERSTVYKVGNYVASQPCKPQNLNPVLGRCMRGSW